MFPTNAVFPANVVPARETKAALLTAGEERLRALLSPASNWVYSLCINLGDRGGGGGQGMGDSFFLRSNDRPLLCSPLLPPVSQEGRQPGRDARAGAVPVLVPPVLRVPLPQGELEVIDQRRRWRRFVWPWVVTSGTPFLQVSPGGWQRLSPSPPDVEHSWGWGFCWSVWWIRAQLHAGAGTVLVWNFLVWNFLVGQVHTLPRCWVGG